MAGRKASSTANKIAKGEKLDKEIVLPTHQVHASNVDQFVGKGS